MIKPTTTKINCAGTPIFIGDNVFEKIKNIFKFKDKKIFIILDENTKTLCLPTLIKDIPELSNSYYILLPSGEKNKNIDVCVKVWENLMKMNLDRQSLIINLGGGVVSDTGGFIASTIKRGVMFINIPTTLMAMIDAAIGGKVGIDVNAIKNQVGLYSTAEAVFVNPVFLQSLSRQQIISGFAEMIKHALIADDTYWEKIKYADFANNKKTLELIVQSIKIKSEIVTKDFKEKSIRKHLNFGHTIGHALETLSLQKDKKPLLHGEAIAAGIICETYLSNKLCGLSKKKNEEIVSFICSLYKPYTLNKKDIISLIELMRYDKKHTNDIFNLSLITKIGNCKTDCICTAEQLTESLEFYNNLIC